VRLMIVKITHLFVCSLLIAFLVTGASEALAQQNQPITATFAEEFWNTSNGGSLEIQTSGRYLLFTEDAGNGGRPLQSEGQVTALIGSVNAEHTYTLQPTTQGQMKWTFEIHANQDGTGDLYVTRNGSKHLVTHLNR
jgi:hypothetical protein